MDHDGPLDLPRLLFVFQMEKIYGRIKGYQGVVIKKLR